MIYNELIQRGTSDFPIELYELDKNHPRYEMTAHWHNDIELVHVTKGELLIKLDYREYKAKAGDFVFINSEIIHSAIPQKNCLYECIVMNFNIISSEDVQCQFFIDSILNHDIHIEEYHNFSSSPFNDTLSMLFDSLRHKNKGYKFEVISLLYKLLFVIENEKMYVPTSGSSLIYNSKGIPKLKIILAYIRENYANEITLDDISKQLKMSPRYLCTFFKNMTGKTPIEYLISYRIECASRKLISTTMSVTEISLTCGFNDLSYFIKTFKSYMNVTPYNYRKKHSI